MRFVLFADRIRSARLRTFCFVVLLSMYWCECVCRVLMLTEDATRNNHDDISHNGCAPLASTWSDNTYIVDDDFHNESQHRSEAASGEAESIVTVPSCLLFSRNNTENLNSHLSLPYVSAVLVNEHFQEESNVLPTVEHPVVLRAVEVDVVSGRIRFELEPNHSTDAPSPKTPLSNLSYSQKSWLIVFVRKWARKTMAISGKAVGTYTPKVKQGVRRSVRAIKDASVQSASFMRQVSMKCKDRVVELNQNQEISPRAQLSMKRVGKNFKHASHSAARGVQKASEATVRGLKELEEKHHIMRKSKRSVKKGGKLIRNIWNGKPMRSDATASGSTTFAADRPSYETQYKMSQPSSE